MNGCTQQYGTFSAVSGDTISVRLYALNADGATIKAQRAADLQQRVSLRR